MTREPIAIVTAGLFDDHHAKTAHGVIRYGSRGIVAVVDERHAGRTAAEVVPFCAREVPIVASVAEAAGRGARTLLVGLAPTGGKLDAGLRAGVVEAIEAGMDVEAGLHTLLRDDPELVAGAERHGVELRDLRVGPDDLEVPSGDPPPAGVRVVHSVGSDCAIGKKVVTLELDRAARGLGRRSVFVPTGQTGIAIAGWGIAVDHLIADYVAGAAERLVTEGAERGDVLFVEGQGGLFHPAYSGVTLGLLHGSRPDALVLAHKAGERTIQGRPDLPLPPLPELIASYEAVCRPIRSAPVVAVALNTSALDERDARAEIERVERECGVPAGDVVRFGPEPILGAALGADG
jgi:uncharacterized NAD-dependent epimerase/dehydratase family protein